VVLDSSVRIFEPGRRARLYWRDLWRYRELFVVLAWRDVAVRYKQTVIGLAWVILQPLVTMVAFTVVFGRLAQLPAEGNAPYALMVFAGLLPWQLFATSLTGASASLLGNSNLITKVYFPRLIIPAAAVVVALVDALVSLTILGGLILWFGVVPSWALLTLPLFVAMAFLASLGPGLLLTALNVKYRDFRYVIPFIVQVGLYISPVGFSSSVVPERWRLLYALNPMVGVIDGFRWAILGGRSPIGTLEFSVSTTVILVLLWLGVRRFRALEHSIADLI
jgi:lipopolysaccharide transport system permease protein